MRFRGRAFGFRPRNRAPTRVGEPALGVPLGFMETLIGGLIAATVAAAILSGLWFLGVRLRRRGGGGDVMGPFDELWHPSAHRFRQEIHTYEQRMVPRPAPDDRGHT